jgi:hypothetical protein
MGFAEATTVTAEGGGRYRTEIAEGWDVAGNANGGYLLALVTRALLDATGRPDPLTVTAHYLAPGRPGPAVIDTEVVRRGTQLATATGRLVDADGRPLLQVLGTFGDLDRGSSAPELVGADPPELPAVGDCTPREPGEEFPLPFMGRVELRLHPDDAGFAEGRPSGSPQMRGWFRLRADEPVGTLGLLVAVDAFPPTAFNAHLPVGWTPTVELTAHVRARPRPGWLRCRFTTRFVTGGFLEEDGEVWDASGQLVAQSRQLALVPRGR